MNNLKHSANQTLEVFGLLLLIMAVSSLINPTFIPIIGNEIYILGMFTAMVLGKYFLYKSKDKKENGSSEKNENKEMAYVKNLKFCTDEALNSFGILLLIMTVSAFINPNLAPLIGNEVYILFLFAFMVPARYFLYKGRSKKENQNNAVV